MQGPRILLWIEVYVYTAGIWHAGSADMLGRLSGRHAALHGGSVIRELQGLPQWQAHLHLGSLAAREELEARSRAHTTCSAPSLLG